MIYYSVIIYQREIQQNAEAMSEKLITIQHSTIQFAAVLGIINCRILWYTV